MKKTLITILCCCGIATASAATVTKDAYTFPGSGTSINLGSDVLDTLDNGGESFAISYELKDLTLNDIVTAGGTFFELKGDKKTITLGYNSYLGFVSSGIGGMQTNSFVPFIPESVPFLFQYNSDTKEFTFSYYMEYDSQENPHDLTTILSVNLAKTIFSKPVLHPAASPLHCLLVLPKKSIHGTASFQLMT